MKTEGTLCKGHVAEVTLVYLRNYKNILEAGTHRKVGDNSTGKAGIVGKIMAPQSYLPLIPVNKLPYMAEGLYGSNN